MNHKRKRPKSRRAGCLMCKGWKHQRVNRDSAKAQYRGNARPSESPRRAIARELEAA